MKKKTSFPRKDLFIFCFFLICSCRVFAKTYSLQEAIFVSVESISKKIDGKVDVLGFADINSKYNRLSDFLYNEFLYAFSQQLDDTSIVERDDDVLKLIDNEIDYQYSGKVNDDTIQSMCNSLGADSLLFGSLQEDTSGWKLELKIIHVESKKLIAMWKGIIKKNDRDIQFQLKQSEKKGTKNQSLTQTLSDDNDNPKDKYITAKNVPNGIEVTIYKHKDDPEWTYNRIIIEEDDKEMMFSYSYFKNSKSILENSNKKSFIYPFVKKDSTYKFTIYPFNGVSDSVSVISEITSDLQIVNPEKLYNFEVLYEQADESKHLNRIVKINMNPNEIFTKPGLLRYTQIQVVMYNEDGEFLYNLGHNPKQEKRLIEKGLNIMNNMDCEYYNTSSSKIKKELDSGNTINFVASFSFSVEPYSENTGAYYFSLGNYSFPWDVVK